MSNQPVGDNPTGARISVLAIDDSEEFRELIKELLKPHGFDVVTAGNPVKALEVFTRLKEQIQLVLLDYYMPQLDGGKTFEWLRKLNPTIPVIICSGADEMRLRHLQAQHAIDGYIHKPVRIEEVLHVIRQVLAKQAAPS
jgi:CheY-like chemotaxis protein